MSMQNAEITALLFNRLADLLYFTGSKAHNIALRALAMRRKYKLNEYGLIVDGKRVAGKTGKAVYAKLGLPCIEPESRGNRGEIEAAQRGKLPALVTRETIRDDLHCHTLATDGQDSLEAMVEAARALGYEYLAISDHTQHLAVAHGLDRRRLLAEFRDIHRLNDKLDDIVVLKAIEVDILEDGKLDLPDSLLRQLAYMRFGVNQARRGWLEPADVINMRPLAALRKLLKRK